MKQQNGICIFLAVAALAIGCHTEETTSQQIHKVEEKTKATAQDMKDYAYTQKAEFVDKMTNQLAEINRDLDQLTAKVEKASDAAKAEAKPKLQALREKADQLRKQVDKAKESTEATWNDVKADSKKVYHDLKDGFNQARQWLSDKIAP